MWRLQPINNAERTFYHNCTAILFHCRTPLMGRHNLNYECLKATPLLPVGLSCPATKNIVCFHLPILGFALSRTGTTNSPQRPVTTHNVRPSYIFSIFQHCKLVADFVPKWLLQVRSKLDQFKLEKKLLLNVLQSLQLETICSNKCSDFNLVK